MSAFLCWLFGHRPYRNVNPDRSLVFHCSRCHILVVGGAAARSRK